MDDPFVNEISAKVEEIKQNDEKRGEFMTFEEIVEWENKKVAEQTRKAVEAEFAAKFENMARKLKAKGMDFSEIAELTGLSEEEIEKL